MKFKQFVKALGGEGTIYEAPNGERWLGGVIGTFTMAKIPSFQTGIIGRTIKPMPDRLLDILHMDEVDADLISARMEYPDDKASDILRGFGNSQDRVEIKNKQFGFIEKSDLKGIGFYEDDIGILFLSKYIGPNETEIQCIMFDYTFMEQEDYSIWE